MKTGQFFEGSHIPGRRDVSHTPHKRPRRGRKQDSFLKGRTYPVVRAYRIRPHRRPRRGRKRGGFSKGRTYPVGELHRYFEGSHVPDRRGVLHTPHRRPRRGRKQDSFRNRWWYLVGRMQYVPTLSADKDSINRHAFATSNRQSQGLRFRRTYFLKTIVRITFSEILLSGGETKDYIPGDSAFWR